MVGLASDMLSPLSALSPRSGRTCKHGAEEATDLVERIVLVASVAEGVLMDAAADFTRGCWHSMAHGAASLGGSEAGQHGRATGQLGPWFRSWSPAS
jgi:hypothetical protein